MWLSQVLSCICRIIGQTCASTREADPMASCVWLCHLWQVLTCIWTESPSVESCIPQEASAIAWELVWWAHPVSKASISILSMLQSIALIDWVSEQKTYNSQTLKSHLHSPVCAWLPASVRYFQILRMTKIRLKTNLQTFLICDSKGEHRVKSNTWCLDFAARLNFTVT